MRKWYNIFISHSWRHSDKYEKLTSLLDKVEDFPYRDLSIPVTNPIENISTNKALAKEIEDQILNATVVVVIAGMFVTESKWMKKEMEIAKNSFNKPKKILAVRLLGSERSSTLAQDSADATVGWDGPSIAKKIKELTKEKESEDS